MDVFDELLEVANRLNGPNGCPWDRKQNFYSLQPYVLEEAHEVIEAVDLNDDQKILEELGDLLYQVVFYAKLAEKDQRFTMEDVVASIKEKLIRRHPHVFGEVKVDTSEEVVKNWEKIKSEEKGHEQRESAIDGIPKTLSIIARAQKVLKKVKKAAYPYAQETKIAPKSEEEFGKEFLNLIMQAEEMEIDSESALRRCLWQLEENFRKWEKAPK